MKDTVSVSKQKSKAAAAEQAAQRQSRGANASKKGKAAADSDEESADNNNSHPAPERDFARTLSSAPKRLNDIAQAPPSLHAGPRLQRKVKDSSTSSSKDDGVVSNAQKRMMELEREKAITRYRALKEAKLRDRDKDTIASELSVRA